MGVEPTFEQEAARTTVFNTVEQLFIRAPGWPTQVPLELKSREFVLFARPRGASVSPVWQQIWQQVRRAMGRA